MTVQGDGLAAAMRRAFSFCGALLVGNTRARRITAPDRQDLGGNPYIS